MDIRPRNEPRNELLGVFARGLLLGFGVLAILLGLTALQPLS